MFGWFKRKQHWVDEPDEVYRTRERADAALVQTARASTLPVIVASFFPGSLERIEADLQAANVTFARLAFGGGQDNVATEVWTLDASRLAQQYSFDGWLLAAGKSFSFLFVEHHPLPSVEQIFLGVLDDVSKAKRQHVRFFIGLDEPLMQACGGSRIAQLMDQLGMGADEVIRHPMVDRSIVRAQQKLEKAAPNALPTNSPEEWFASNLPPRG